MKIHHLFLCVVTLLSNVCAEIIVKEGTIDDWNACCNIARTMHTPLLKELSREDYWLSYLFGLSNPEKLMTKNLAKTHDLVFKDKSCELFVLHEINPNNNDSKVIGFFSFIINEKNNTLAHYARHGYLKEEISPEEFKNACLNYFVTQDKYKNLECLFSIDLIPTAKGPLMAEHRNQSIAFGFVVSDDPRAFDHLSWYKKIPLQWLLTTQVYTLDIKQLREQAFAN